MVMQLKKIFSNVISMIDRSFKLTILAPGMYGGGAERSMLKLAGGLVALGYSVDLLLVRAEGPLLPEVPKTVRVINLNASSVLLSVPALIKYLRCEEPIALLSVLHTNLIAILAQRLAQVSLRVVVGERNTLSYTTKHHKADFRMRVMPYLNRLFYPWADSIIAVSMGVADDCQVTFDFVSDIPVSGSGKYRYIISEVQA